LEQEFATTLPASTLSAGAAASAAVTEPAVEELPDSSSVPVSSSFLPTCGLKADGFAIRTYVLADPAVTPAVVVAPDVPAVPAADAESGAVDGTASVNMNFASAGGAAFVAAVLPAVPAVVPAVVPVVPTVPDESPGACGAAFRHPVTVSFALGLVAAPG
jgi:hypothetical protein